MELEIDLHPPNGSQEVLNADNVTSQPSFSRTKPAVPTAQTPSGRLLDLQTSKAVDRRSSITNFEVSLSFAARVIDGAWSPGLAGKAIQ